MPAILFLLFTLSARSAFAAVTITINNATGSLTIGQSFSLSASASGLATDSGYYAKIRIGSTSGSLNRGQTQSGSDWLSDTDDWTKFPPIFADSAGFWSGNLTGQPGSLTSPGRNLVVLRLRKISTGTNYDSAALPVTIEAGAEQLPVETQSNPNPQVDWSTVSSGQLGQAFRLSFSIKNFDRNSDYFVKMLGGQTQTRSDWLSLNDSWARFPKFTTNDQGFASGEISGRINPANNAGDYQIGLRFHPSDGGDNIDSGLKTVNFLDPPAVLAYAAAPVPASKTAATSDPTVSTAAPEVNLVLGTSSAATKSAATAPLAKKSSGEGKPLAVQPLTIIMILLGLVAAATGGFFLYRRQFGV